MEVEQKTPQLEVNPKRVDRYRYGAAIEGEDEMRVRDARRVHAKSYLSEGFLNTDGVDENGEVKATIDKARGEAVRYYVGYDTQGEPVSTLRTIDAEKSGGFENLPGYGMAKAALSFEAKEFLRRAEAEGRPIKEISSFGHVPEVTSVAGLEILRHAFQEARERGEVWFFTMVSEKSRALTHAFGPRAFRAAGESVALESTGVNGVHLTPGIVDTATFLDDIKDAAVDEASEKYRERYLASLRNYSEGIDPIYLSEEVKTLLDSSSEVGFMEYVRTRGVKTEQEPWTPPLRLDYSNRFDRIYGKRLVDRGDATMVLDPKWGEEFRDSKDGVLEDEREGSWFYYPWNKTIVHFPDEAEYHALIHARDRDIVTADEQEALKTPSALFAGLSVGSHVHEHMTYAGVGGTHYLADFDTIEGSNLNRINARALQVGEVKADVSAKASSELNPYVNQELLRQGITRYTLDALEAVPDIIFDEVDDFAAKALLRLYAQEHKKPLIMASDVGYKSIIDVERYDKGAQLFNGRLNQQTIEAMIEGKLSPEENMKVTTRLIGLSNASFRLLQSVNNPALTAFPQLELAASQGGALATIAARDILLGRDVKSGRSVHDARKGLKLPSEMSFVEGFSVLKTFLKNTYTTKAN